MCLREVINLIFLRAIYLTSVGHLSFGKAPAPARLQLHYAKACTISKTTDGGGEKGRGFCASSEEEKKKKSRQWEKTRCCKVFNTDLELCDVSALASAAAGLNYSKHFVSTAVSLQAAHTSLCACKGFSQQPWR